MSTGTTSHTRYFESIDGLRLLASINIVLFHLEGMGGLNDLNGSPGWLFRIIKGPAFHASLFFMLAGFIYTVKYAARADTLSTRTLITGRLRDLYPLHAATTLMMVPFAFFSLPVPGLENIVGIVFSCIVHLSMLWSFFPLTPHALNRPSWALSAFMLCYLLFGPLLRRVIVPARRRTVIALMVFCGVPGLVWSAFFASVHHHDVYAFFHVFAPVRFFEFMLGMLLARLYHLNITRSRSFRIRDIPWLNDMLIAGTLIVLFFNLRLTAVSNPFLRFAAYHVFVLPLYATLLYRLARGNGIIARLFAFPAVRNLGKCSFYPYLLHIPLVSWLCRIIDRQAGNSHFLHSPGNIALVMGTLYGGSCLFWLLRRKHRKPTYRTHTPAGTSWNHK
jgi:peptidoglycan/LPS O-acetylase OafA/YrhL